MIKVFTRLIRRRINFGLLPIPFLVILLVDCATNTMLSTPSHKATPLPSIAILASQPGIGISVSPDPSAVNHTAGNLDALSTPTPASVLPNHTPSPSPVVTPTQLPPDYWKSLPIIPTLSQKARDIYQYGVSLGRDPHAFSKIGDCQSITTYFLKYFDMPGFYKLGANDSLQETIDWYADSFSRDSLAVKGGFNAAAILSPLRADPKQCHADENPVACEIRVHNPSIAIVSLEEWWAGHPENYAAYMRQIIEYLIQQGVVPIIATKADNLEGNNLINQTIASLALEYDIPLWNFWLAVQPLPNHGLIAYDPYGAVDMFHLTHSDNYYLYDNPSAILSGWAVRNLTALQALDSVRRAVNDSQ